MSEQKDFLIKLSWTDPVSKEARQALFPLPISMGRSEENTISLVSLAVSRRHCEILNDGNKVYIVDLNSANGTYIGSTKIDRYRLTDGDEILVGDVVMKVEFKGADERRTSRKPSMDVLYGALEEGEQSSTAIPLASIDKRAKALFVDRDKIQDMVTQIGGVGQMQTQQLSGEELKSFLSRGMQKDVGENISPDVQAVVSQHQAPRDTGKVSVPSPRPETCTEPPAPAPTGLAKLWDSVRRLFGRK
jgi:predicted component of type VI protein secretion system